MKSLIPILMVLALGRSVDRGSSAGTDAAQVIGSPGVRTLAMPGPGTAQQNAAALTRFFATPGTATLEIPSGTYLLPCGTYFAASGSLSIAGAGADRSVLKLERACPLSSALMSWISKSNVHLSGFKVDLNNSYSSSRQGILQFHAYDGDAHDLRIDHVAIVNGNTNSLQIVAAAASGFTYSGVVIDSNTLEMTPGPSQDQCIALTTVNGSGKIPSAQITNNVCRGSGIQVDGDAPVVANNDVSNFRFGTGIFLAFVSSGKIAAARWSHGLATLEYADRGLSFARGQTIHVWGASPRGYNGTFTVAGASPGRVSVTLPTNPGAYLGGAFIAAEPSSRNCVVTNNHLHDTEQALDINRTAPGGIENNCVNSRIENNQAVNLGGAAFTNFANGTVYRNNYAAAVGYSKAGSADGDGDAAAFSIMDNGSGMPWYQSHDLVFEGNVVEPRGSRPRYGYFEEPWHLFGATIGKNSFAGAEAPMIRRTAACPAAPVRC